MGPKKNKNRNGARSKPAPDQPRATPPDTAPGPTAASNGLIPGLFALFESVFFGDAPEQRPGAAGGGGGGADATPADDTTKDAAIARAVLGSEDAKKEMERKEAAKKLAEKKQARAAATMQHRGICLNRVCRRRWCYSRKYPSYEHRCQSYHRRQSPTPSATRTLTCNAQRTRC